MAWFRLSILLLLLIPGVLHATPDGTWREQRPLRRAGHTAVYDAVRDRMLLVGGVVENFQQDPQYDGTTSDVWALELFSPGAWLEVHTSGPKPPPRFMPVVVLDPVRNRLLLWGGRGADPGVLWILSLSGPPTWSAVATAGAGPWSRHGAGAAYDPVRDQLVIFGGRDDFNILRNDVWTLSLGVTPTWNAVSPTGTPPVSRTGAAFAYDVPRDRFVLLGGECAVPPTFRADVWALELSGTPSWSSVAPTGGPPTPRTRATMVYVPATERFVVFGGYQNYAYLSDAWALDVSGAPAWSALAAAGGPPSPRDAHVAVFDPVRNHMLVHGGNTFYGGDEGWRLDLSGAPAWSMLPMHFDRPDARRGATVIADPTNARLVAFGGGAPNNETWTVPIGTGTVLDWTRLTTGGTTPPARRFHSAIVDPVRRRMVVFGGVTTGGTTALNDVWTLPLDGAPDWVQLQPTGSKPTARSGHAAIYDPVGDRMVIFGGATGTTEHADVYAMTLGASPAWSKISPTGAPPSARSMMSVAYDAPNTRMVLFGGYAQTTLQAFGDTWALQLSGTPAWVPLLPNGAGPTERGGASTAIDGLRNRMLLFGGIGPYGTERTNETWSFDLGTLQWAQLQPEGFVPSIRADGIAAYDSLADRLVVYGGYTGFEFSDVNWTLDFADATVSVPHPGVTTSLALHGAMPNPVSGDLIVWFRLPDAEPARLELFDLAGRRIESRNVGALGPGRHSATLAPAGRLAAGIYLIRLTRGSEERTARAVVLR